MKEKGERAEELETQLQKLERDNESLQKKVASLGITCEKVGLLRLSVDLYTDVNGSLITLIFIHLLCA